VAGRTAAVGALGLALLLAGCGGGSKYTYSFAANGNNAFDRGIYLRVISPIKVPDSAFKNAKRVDHVSGPKVCSITQTVKDPPAKYAEFAGKKLTIEIYGTNPLAKLICSIARKGTTQIFKP
jgi:hypothetical protein